jgi:hypothetical protein
MMLLAGSEDFHVQPILERSLWAARYYLAVMGFGLLYFGIAEGLFGAGIGKRLKGLCVVRSRGRRPGLGRGLLRILVPILSCEIVRIPLLMATIPVSRIDDMTAFHVTIFFLASFACPWIPVLLTLTARRDNGFATVWDLMSGTRVVLKPTGLVRPTVPLPDSGAIAPETSKTLGPYQIARELIPERWIVATDPVLRRRVWLTRRPATGLPVERRNVARITRPRWLQEVETDSGMWDAFEAVRGAPLSGLVAGGKRVPWKTLRCWLDDLASELWAASADGSLPPESSLDHVWITADGRAVLLDQPWPETERPAERIPIGDVAGQQKLLSRVAALAQTTGLPLHARPVLRNLAEGRFEKISFLTGTLRGMLDRPAEVGRGIRAGAVFMLPFYTWVMFFVAVTHGAEWLYAVTGDSVLRIAVASSLLVLAAAALTQLLLVPFTTTTSNALFRLAIVDAQGEPAGASRRLLRWVIVWGSLFAPVLLALALTGWTTGSFYLAAMLVLLVWIAGAAFAVVHPGRGLHDRWAGTWVVRR